MAFTMSPEAKARLSTVLENTTEQIPGITATIVNRDGEIILSHQAGSMAANSLLWLASCTKLFTAVATMQLLEQGKLELDDESIVERLCPELMDLRVLDGVDEKGETKYVKKENAITVRMLLSHTGKPGV